MRGWRFHGAGKLLVAICKGSVDRKHHDRIPRSSRGSIISLPRAISTTRVFIVAGEPSGDAIGSRLMISLRDLSSLPMEFAGVGGPLMIREGLQSQFQMEDISVMGMVELIPHAIRLWSRLRETIAAAHRFQPNVVITVDAKGFSFRVLAGIRDAYAETGQCCPPTVHYVSPSFWAWKGGEEKLKNLSKIVDHMLCILPFEEAACKASGLGATFVGHPIVEDASSVAANGGPHDGRNWWIKGDGDGFRQRHGLHSGVTVLSVLPGSRLQEVRRMLPIYQETINLLKRSVPDLSVVIPTVPSEIVTREVEALVEDWKVPLVLLRGASDTDKYNAFAASNAALCTSGTAVMQLLMAHVPCVVGYRAHPITEWIIRYRTKLSFISLPNILLDSAVIPEALFGACTAARLVSYIRELLEEKELQQKQVLMAEEVMRILAPPSKYEMIFSTHVSKCSGALVPSLRPSMVAAHSILEILEKSGLRE